MLHIADTLGAVGLSSWLMPGEMSPCLLLGFLVAWVLFVYVNAQTVECHLGGCGMAPAGAR
jgi:predicted Co/Zn/Cd cation transporter (cation efflux family)